MTEDQMIDAVFVREGSTYEEPPRIDQPTGPGGITLPVLTAYRGLLSHVQDLRALTVIEAREVVRWDLRRLASQAGINRLEFEPLRLQMIDFAYNSGEGIAIRWLQRVLGVPRTSLMDAETVAAANQPIRRWPVLVHQALIAARLEMIDLSTDAFAAGRKGIDKKFEEGLENRALTFSLLEVP